MKRAAVFAHYDKDSLIDDYVLYYLKELKTIADTVVFVSCCDLPEEETSKLKGIVSHVITEKHDEYDFGSYKRGFLFLKDRLDDFDELIFANDSCYGPLYPLEKVFSKMEKENCDFWGITKNRFGIIKVDGEYKLTKRPHLQSYFLVFKNNVFLADVFYNFIQSIKHYENKNDIIINCEIALTEKLKEAGFSYSPFIKRFMQFSSVLIYFWRLLIEYCNMPFIKCTILRNPRVHMTTVQDWKKVILKNSNYPVELIENNLQRENNLKIQNDSYPIFLFKKYFFYFVGFQPKITKNFFIHLCEKFML